jgi:hypothetical protein
MIVREADIEAARKSLPADVTVLIVDPVGYYILYEIPSGDLRIRFRASAAWLPNQPTPGTNRSPKTRAGIMSGGRVLVLEGLHRTRAMARDQMMIAQWLGGVAHAPGWLDFGYDSEGAILSSSSIERSGPWTLVPAK